MKLYFCLLSTFLSSIIFSQSSKPSVAKEPVWITQNVIDYNKVLLDNQAADGYIDVAYETQVSLGDQSEYIRRSKKIISQAGVQNGSQISVGFDPSYQQLIFHTIRIIRNGETLNKLQLAAIKTIHQEQDINNFIYSGILNALLILEDIRQGDVIEYSYTIKGFNPIFKNKYVEDFRLQYSIPIYDLYYKLIVPAGRKVNIKNINPSLQSTNSTINGSQVYEWHKNNIAAMVTQDYTPSWYDPYAQILISEFNNWKEVNDWAMELFPLKRELSPALQKKVKEIETAHANLEDRTKAALQFVQDDIRYMGIEMGENSHKPADPSKVFAQRFGDCKEKSYLLCLMLKAMGITSNVVLINTGNKKNIANWLPAPTDFDHATIRVKLADGYHWFDPTIAYQRGNIKDLYYPDYQVGFVIGDSTTDLTTIAFRNVSYLHVKEVFAVPAMYGSGTFVVTTTYKGANADGIRNDYNTISNRELMTNNQKFYAPYYDDIKADSVTHTDNDSTGIFTTNEYYTISKFWNIEKNNTDKFSFSPFMIDASFTRPKEKNRTMPFKLVYPSSYEEEVIVDLPHDWNVTESEHHFKNANFTYNSKFYCEGNRVHLVADYENLTNNVSIDEAEQYFNDYKEYAEGANYKLTYGDDSADDDAGINKSSSHTSGKNIFITIFGIVIILGLIRKGYIDTRRRY